MAPSAGMYAGGLHSQCCNRDLPGANDSSYGHWEQDAAMFVAWKVDYLKSDPCGVHAKGDAIGRFNQRWVDAFTQLGYIDKLHFQGDLVCGYRPGASAGCLNRTAAMANSWRYTQSFASEISAPLLTGARFFHAEPPVIFGITSHTS